MQENSPFITDMLYFIQAFYYLQMETEPTPETASIIHYADNEQCGKKVLPR
jgi:hypothetical protein